MIKQLIILGLLINYSYSACTASSTDATVSADGSGQNDYVFGKCCAIDTSATPIVYKQPASVTTCATATASTSAAAALVSATGCATGYALNTDACTHCAAGYGWTAATGVCAGCSIGQYSAGVQATCATCPLGSASAATATSCTACGDNQYVKSADGTCANRDANATGNINNCKVYDAATDGKCLKAKDGFITITAATTTAPTACFANCKTCATDNTLPNCSVAMDGYYLNDATTQALNPCQADGLCAVCKYTPVSGAPGNGKVSCEKAKAGAYLDKTVADAVVAKACPATKGSIADNPGELASCSACDTSTKFCGNCTTTTDCSTCLPGYVLTARTATTEGKCVKFEGTKHATCDKANDTTESACQACIATQNRELEDDAASTTTPKAKLAVSKCVCKPGFADKSKITVAAGAAVDYVCEACGTNVATCSFSATGVKKADTCNTGFYPVGAECKAKDATDVALAFWDTVTSTFKACNGSCQKCTGATASACTACLDAPSNWVEPTSSAANYATYIKGVRALINGTCYSDCPTGWVANSARSNCVAGTASGTGSASGVFAVLSLAISLFLIF